VKVSCDSIAASKKKNNKVDARKISDLLRCNLLPECYMAPCAIREMRRMLRYRNLVVRQATRMKNRIAGLLMEPGPMVKNSICLNPIMVAG
jgi:transposase